MVSKSVCPYGLWQKSARNLCQAYLCTQSSVIQCANRCAETTQVLADGEQENQPQHVSEVTPESRPRKTRKMESTSDKHVIYRVGWDGSICHWMPAHEVMASEREAPTEVWKCLPSAVLDACRGALSFFCSLWLVICSGRQLWGRWLVKLVSAKGCLLSLSVTKLSDAKLSY